MNTGPPSLWNLVRKHVKNEGLAITLKPGAGVYYNRLGNIDTYLPGMRGVRNAGPFVLVKPIVVTVVGEDGMPRTLKYLSPVKIKTVVTEYKTRLPEENRGKNIVFSDRNGKTVYIDDVIKRDTTLRATVRDTQTRGQMMEVQKRQFILAIEGVDVKTIQRLLDDGFPVDVRFPRRLSGTALVYAATLGHVPIVKLLLDRGAAVNAKTNSGRTALMNAAYQGHISTFKMLLARGAAVNVKDAQGRTALTEAAFKGRGDIVRLLLDKDPTLIDIGDNDGDTALKNACATNNESIVRLLLNRGASVNVRGYQGTTALISSTRQGNANIVKLLLDRGALVNIEDMHGRTALSYAMLLQDQNAERIIEMLREKARIQNSARKRKRT